LAAAAIAPVAFAQSNTIQAIPQNVIFTTQVDGPPTGSGSIAVAGNGAIAFQVRTSTTTGGNWLTAKQTTGTTPSIVELTANRQGLDPGAYYGTIQVTPAGGQSVTVAATLNVCVVPKNPLVDPCFPGQGPITSPTGTLSALPTNMVLNVVRTQAPAQQLLTILAGATPVNGTVQTTTKDGGTWLTVDHNTFQTPTQLQVIAAGQNMARGTYSGQVTLTAPGSSPIVVSVSMHVLDPAPPVYSIDPSSVPAPSPDTIFTIKGANFREGAQIILMITTPIQGTTSLILPTTPQLVDSNTLRVLIPGSFLTDPTVLGLQVALPDALVSDTLKVTVGHPAPAIRSSNGIVSAASATGGPIAPGQMISIFGSAMGPQSGVSGTVDGLGALAQTVSGVRVLFDGVPAGVQYASDGQVNAVAPNSISGRTSTNVSVEYNGMRSAVVAMNVAAASPGLFSLSGDGKGQVLLIHDGGVATGVLQAVAPGEVVTMYATGTGLLDNSAGDAHLAPGIERPMLPLTVKVGGQNADILYAGTSPGLLEAVLQINIRIPDTAPLGSDIPVELITGDFHSQPGLTMVVK